MPSFVSQPPLFNPMATEGNAHQSTQASGFGVLDQYLGYRFGDPVTINQSPGASCQPLGASYRAAVVRALQSPGIVSPSRGCPFARHGCMTAVFSRDLSECYFGPERPAGNVANYMGQMAMSMGKLVSLEGFLIQADNLRQQTLQQMHRILTTRQSARALLVINDYTSSLRALSSLWLARPQE